MQNDEHESAVWHWPAKSASAGRRVEFAAPIELQAQTRRPDGQRRSTRSMSPRASHWPTSLASATQAASATLAASITLHA